MHLLNVALEDIMHHAEAIVLVAMEAFNAFVDGGFAFGVGDYGHDRVELHWKYRLSV